MTQGKDCISVFGVNESYHSQFHAMGFWPLQSRS
jgi:hypothetical protein